MRMETEEPSVSPEPERETKHHHLMCGIPSQRSAFKRWGAFLAVAIVLTGALGRLDVETLLWAGAPLLLLGLAEAGYVAEERRHAEMLQARDGNAGSPVMPPESAVITIQRTTSAMLSISIWPFYLGLFIIVAAGASGFTSRNAPPPVAVAVDNSPVTFSGTPSVVPTNKLKPVQVIPQQRPDGSALPMQTGANPANRQVTPTIFQRAATPFSNGPKPVFRKPITPPASPGAEQPPAPPATPARQNP